MTRENASSMPPPTLYGNKRHVFFFVAFAGLAVIVLFAGWFVHWIKHRPLSPIQIAIAMPFTGPQAEQGKLILNAVEFCLDEVNRQGGVRGHPLRVVAYDDQGKPDVALQKAKEIAASPAVAVIGHSTSATSVGPGQIYKAARIPAITAAASAPVVTADNPYYFRVTIDTSSQGHTMAAYAKKVLGANYASVLYSDEVYGKSLAAAFDDEFVEEGGTLDKHWAWNLYATDKAHAALMDQVSDDIAQGQGGIVILAISPYSAAKDALIRLRRTGVNPVILGGSALRNDFPRLFMAEPEEKREPGFFTNNTYIASPIIYDSSSERALSFSDRFYRAYHSQPDEGAAKHYEAALLIAEALRQGGAQLTESNRDDDRQRIRSWLGAQDNAAHAITGLTGPLYFDDTQSLKQAVRIGRCVEDRFVSAPVQLEAVPNPALIDLDAELAAGRVIRILQTFYWLQRVVYTGIDINQVSRVDTSKGTFTADFYLWFRYAGDDAVRDVDLNAATEKSPYDAKSPLLQQQINGLHYALYRVRGDFRTTYDFHDYPFDAQALIIRLTNPHMTREQVIYAIDTFGLRLPRPDGGVSQLRPLSNWDFTHVLHESDTLTSHSTRGQPGAFHSNYETQFSGFNVVIGVKRKTLVFLFKTLLPLLLLVLVVYVTLYFPVSLTKERLTIAISAMLASAVLLTAINSLLTDVGYTTAIEYGFYSFFGLCLYCVIAGLITEKLHARKNSDLAVRFDIAARIIYPMITLVVFAYYYFRYF
jgi:branched-chain amino acid transport system substrate-binding protein